MRTWLTISLAISLLSVVDTLSAQETTDAMPRQTMSDVVYNTLRRAIESSRLNESRKKRNLAALDNLRDVLWPDVSKLERVHLYGLENNDDRFINMWCLRREEEPITVVTPEFKVIRLSKKEYSRIDVFDYAEELHELVRLARAADAEDRGAVSDIAADYIDGQPWPHWGGIYHACAAAFLGKSDISEILLKHALSYEDVLARILDNWAWEGFYKGIELLENGKPRTEVLGAWAQSIKTYPHSRYLEQLLDYTDTLREQIDQEIDTVANTVDDPSKLPIKQQIAYFIARFPDVHGIAGWPGGPCETVGPGPPLGGSGTWLSDSVVQIGRPAVPMLINQLVDRRLTRTVGLHRRHEPACTVLRVQDVALECIEKITDVRFYGNAGLTCFSTASPERRHEVIHAIVDWWEEASRQIEKQ